MTPVQIIAGIAALLALAVALYCAWQVRRNVRRVEAAFAARVPGGQSTAATSTAPSEGDR